MLLSQEFKLLIGGQLQTRSAQLDVINPATEAIIARVPRASAEDAQAAVAAARQAFPGWRDTPISERQAMLRAVADAVEQHTEELIRLITLEQGKPRAGAQDEVLTGIGVARFFSSFDLTPEVVQDDAQQRIELHRRPLGVVVAIVPWNFPFLMAMYKLAPALLAGNTVVIKPSPTTPLSTLRLAEILQPVLPAGVLNVVTDDGSIGPILSEHPDVAKISFTGSTATGRAVMASAAPTIKRLTLELGGNDAAIVLDDVDVEKVAPALFAMAFVNSGQVCMSIKRLYIQAGIYEAMCEAFARLAREAVMGDGMNPATQYGPVQNKRQFEAVCKVLEEAPRYGRIIAGGQVQRPGYFIRPTVIRDITEGNPVVDREIFGPVRSLMRFETVDEAVRRANASEFGLGGSVWSSDVQKATSIASQLECGSAWVNQHFAMSPFAPFGGVKQSGLGVEFSIHGLHEYTSLQSLVISKA
jgi:acyl-CoA reductase-like NAD-dependent aldehyde dehydrogenase